MGFRVPRFVGRGLEVRVQNMQSGKNGGWRVEVAETGRLGFRVQGWNGVGRTDEFRRHRFRRREFGR
jgi:hypothetical protein